MADSPLAGRPSHGYAVPAFRVACLLSRCDRRFAPMSRAQVCDSMFHGTRGRVRIRVAIARGGVALRECRVASVTIMRAERRALMRRECRARRIAVAASVAIVASRRCLVRDVRASVTSCSMSREDASGCALRLRAKASSFDVARVRVVSDRHVMQHFALRELRRCRDRRVAIVASRSSRCADVSRASYGAREPPPSSLEFTSDRLPALWQRMSVLFVRRQASWAQWPKTRLDARASR